MDYKRFRKRLCERLGRNSADIDALVEGLSIVLRQSCAELDSVAVPAFRHIRPACKHTEAIVDDLSTGKKMLVPPEISIEFRPEPCSSNASANEQHSKSLRADHTRGQGDGHRHQHRPPLPARILRHNRRLGLAEGESVSIKNIGTFRRNSDPLSGMSGAVVFIPDNAVSEEVNKTILHVRTGGTCRNLPTA